MAVPASVPAGEGDGGETVEGSAMGQCMEEALVESVSPAMDPRSGTLSLLGQRRKDDVAALPAPPGSPMPAAVLVVRGGDSDR